MTPAEAIADLDASLARVGEDVKLRKTNSATGQKTVRARVRGYKPDEVIGIIQQGDSKVVISPSCLGSFGMPAINGYVVAGGVPRRIMGIYAPTIQGTVVRIEMQVRG